MLRSLLFVGFCLITNICIWADAPQFAPQIPNAAPPGQIINQVSPPNVPGPLNPPPVAYPVTPYPAPSQVIPVSSTSANVDSQSSSQLRSARPLSGKKKWETLLQSPARLDFGGRSKVTVQEVLNELHKQHQLSIRFDMPTLSFIVAMMQNPEQPPIEGSPVPSSVVPTTPLTVPTPNLTPPLYGAANPASPPATPPTSVPAPVPQYAPGPTVYPNPPTAPIQPSPVIPPGAPSPPATQPITVTPTSPEPAEMPPSAILPSQPEVFNLSMDPLLQKFEVQLDRIDVRNVTIATVLRHTFDATLCVPGISGVAGLPICISNAYLLDYVVEDDGLLITTRMNALTVKETRVYSISHLKEMKPEQLANVVRQSVRPWSWRSRINDLGDQLKEGIPAGTAAAALKIASQTGVVTIDPPTNPQVSDAVVKTLVESPNGNVTQNVDVDPAVAINALVNGLVTTAQASISAMEMIHFADPPTGTVQVLPGKLIITQSQAAHREIAELIEQLE